MNNWNEIMKNEVFITDLGENKTSVINGKEVVVGRYAVWSPVSNGEGHQVIEVGEDLEFLMEKYNISQDKVCKLLTKESE